MIFIYILIILLLIITLYLLNKNNNQEYFTSEESENTPKCNDFFSKNSFCEFDVDTNVCNCKFQKDDVKYIFNSPENCCQETCGKRSKEQCVANNNFTKIPYYCNIGGVCKKYEGTIYESHISVNNCGTDPLNNQLLLPYASLEECSGSVDHCDRYNDPSKSNILNKETCLKDTNCGFCTNDSGGGKCIAGTASGALDMQKYFYCNPTARNGINKYIYGNHSASLLQPANISFSEKV